MENEYKYLSIAENRKRIYDQTASMHFKLSDEYNRLAKVEDAIEIIISVLLCGITFLDFEKYFNITLEHPALLVGFTSIFLLAFTLVKQSLNHKQLCEKHKLAGKMYAQAKIELAARIAEWKISETDNQNIVAYLDGHYSSLNDLPQIPEKHFNRLKHAHYTKVSMSKFLDSHQGESWILCKFKFMLSNKKK